MMKKLRYYARFILVCLLMMKRDLVRTLRTDLRSSVDEFRRIFEANKAATAPDPKAATEVAQAGAEWEEVLQEIELFLNVLIILAC